MPIIRLDLSIIMKIEIGYFCGGRPNGTCLNSSNDKEYIDFRLFNGVNIETVFMDSIG